MAIVNKSGHGVTTVLPANSDAVTVAPLNLPLQKAPATQAGGGPAVPRVSRGSYPPAGSVSTSNADAKGVQSSSKYGVYGK